MTKRDVKYVVVGGGVGLGALIAAFFYFRRRRTIPEISPAIVRWESP